MKQVIAGMLNPGMFSLSPIVDVACYFDDEETHVEIERTKPKIAAKPKRNGAPLEGDNDASIRCSCVDIERIHAEEHSNRESAQKTILLTRNG